MKKLSSTKIFIVAISLFVIFILFISGCANSEQNTVSSILNNQTIDPPSLEEQSNSCEERWDCTSSDEKAFLTGECDWINQTKCAFGCRDGDCEKPPSCAEGWGCLNDELRGYRNPDCSWSNKYACDFGCADTLCRLEPLNDTVSGSSEPVQISSTPVENQFFTLEQGQTNQHLIAEETYNVTLYFITEGKIKLDINDDKSSWLVENENYQYQNLNLTIKSIIYSSYSLQQVEYKVNN